MAIGTAAALIGGAGALASGIGSIAQATKSGPGAPISQEELQQRLAAENQAIAQQEQFAQAVAAQRGISRLGEVYSGLGQIGQGPGPDIAGAQLAQATGQNIASQAALMAGQRGAAANPALLARQAAMQGGALQQQAAGQAQTLRLQQADQRERLRMAALGAQGNVAGNLATLQSGALQSAAAGRGAAARAGLQTALGANQQEMQRRGQAASALGGMASGLASAVPQLAQLNQGGEVPTLQEFLDQSPMPARLAYGRKVPGKARVKGDDPKNDVVPALLSPGEIVIPRTKARDPKKAAAFAAAVARRSRRK